MPRQTSSCAWATSTSVQTLSKLEIFIFVAFAWWFSNHLYAFIHQRTCLISFSGKQLCSADQTNKFIWSHKLENERFSFHRMFRGLIVECKHLAWFTQLHREHFSDRVSFSIYIQGNIIFNHFLKYSHHDQANRFFEQCYDLTKRTCKLNELFW